MALHFVSRFALIFFLRDGSNNDCVTRRRSSSFIQSINHMILLKFRLHLGQGKNYFSVHSAAQQDFKLDRDPK